MRPLVLKEDDTLPHAAAPSDEVQLLKAQLAELQAQIAIKDAALAALDDVCRRFEAESDVRATMAAPAPVAGAAITSIPAATLSPALSPTSAVVVRSLGGVGKKRGQLQYPMYDPRPPSTLSGSNYNT